MRQIPASLLTLLAGVGVTLISLWVGQNHHLLPEQASEQAPLVDNFFNVMVTIGTALFLVVQGAIVIFLIKYRKRPGDETDGVPIEGNFSLEIFWTAIPSLIVIGLGIYSVEVYEQMGGLTPPGSHGMAHHAAAHTAMAAPLVADASATEAPKIGSTYGLQKAQPADLTVNVTAMQYAWLFDYPSNGITAGELHVPLGKEVQLNLSGSDVIHAFWVPQFRLKQDVLPGLHNELRFVATKPGTYPIVCAELCGSYHGSMRSQVVVQSQEEYDQWIQENLVAQKDPDTIALNSQSSTPTEFLAPYAEEIGITAQDLVSLH